MWDLVGEDGETADLAWAYQVRRNSSPAKGGLAPSRICTSLNPTSHALSSRRPQRQVDTLCHPFLRYVNSSPMNLEECSRRDYSPLS